jgi:sec-independent protein translocase protein TatA
MSPILAFFEGAFAPSHIIIVLIVGVLLFGKRLPEIGRSLGKGLQEFRRGFSGLEDDVQGTNNPRLEAPPSEAIKPPQKVATTAPKFEDNPPAPPTPPVTPPKAQS